MDNLLTAAIVFFALRIAEKFTNTGLQVTAVKKLCQNTLTILVSNANIRGLRKTLNCKTPVSGLRTLTDLLYDCSTTMLKAKFYKRAIILYHINGNFMRKITDLV